MQVITNLSITKTYLFEMIRKIIFTNYFSEFLYHVNSAHQYFLFISPYLYFNSRKEHNSATIKNISVLLGGLIDQNNAECHMQE